MISKARYLTGIFCFLLVFSAFAQEDTKNQIIEQSIEIIAENNEQEELDLTTLVDVLNYRFQKPLDLNRAGQEELAELMILNGLEVNAIIAHRGRYGRYMSIEELQAVHSLSMEKVKLLRNFTSVSSDVDDLRISWSELWENGDHELFIRSDRVLEELEGHSTISKEDLAENPNRRFLGDPWRHYMRYRFRFQNKVSVGFTAEKDVGEEFFKGTQKNGFDFYSAHAYIKGLGLVHKAIVGDYHVQFGQGLTYWSGLAFGKSADLISIKRNPRGITPYRSADENRFMRGAALSLKKDDWELTFFASSKNRDANILPQDTLSVEQTQSFSALQQSGYHRTPAELEDKNSIQENIQGVNVDWSQYGIRVGARAVRMSLDKELQPSPSLHGLHRFVGSDLSLIGLDYDWVQGNFNLFGEVSRSDNGALSYVNGLLIVMDSRLNLYAYHRHLAEDFQIIYSNPLAESSSMNNERGLLLGIRSDIHKQWTINAWYDRWSHPWLRYQISAPSHGQEAMIQLNHKPNKKVESYVRYRYRSRPKNVDEDELYIPQLGLTRQDNYRWHVRYKVTKGLELRTRVEATRYEREGRATASYGTLFYQDFIVKPKNVPWDLAFRYAIFDTEDYDSRLYAYERDVLYFSRIPAYNGRGTRFYTVLHYRIHRGLDLYAKYARWYYPDRESISTGLTEIQGQRRTDIRIQLRWKF